MQVARVARLRMLRQQFLGTHSGLPKLFSHAEVDDLNLQRPPHDQLELAGPSPNLYVMTTVSIMFTSGHAHA